MLPAAVVGIGVGWLTAAVTPDGLVRLIVGSGGARVRPAHGAPGPGRRRAAHPPPISAWFWGGVAGFTSFVAHAGGPPYQVHTLPLRLDPKVYTGTSVIFFAVGQRGEGAAVRGAGSAGRAHAPVCR
jgi:uncharacterized protein